MPHDFRSVAISLLRNLEDTPEHHLWTLRKDDTTAEARTRMVPAGFELCLYYNGTFLRSEIVRDDRNIGDVADAAKAEWLERGWVV